MRGPGNAQDGFGDGHIVTVARRYLYRVAALSAAGATTRVQRCCSEKGTQPRCTFIQAISRKERQPNLRAAWRRSPVRNPGWIRSAMVSLTKKTSYTATRPRWPF